MAKDDPMLSLVTRHKLSYLRLYDLIMRRVKTAGSAALQSEDG